MPLGANNHEDMELVDSIRGLMRQDSVDQETSEQRLSRLLEAHAHRVVTGAPPPSGTRNVLTRCGDLFLTLIGHPDAYGVAVFFLPGTEDQMPLYYGNWAGKHPSAKEMQGRISANKRLLQHNRYPSFNYTTVLAENRHRRVLSLDPAGHFFQVVRCFADALPTIDPTTPINASRNGCGVDGLSIWAHPEQAEWLTWRFPTTPPTEIRWKPRDTYKPLVGSLITVGDNTIVLANTFVPSLSEVTSVFCRMHEKAAHLIFGPLYNAVLRGKSESLRHRLGRKRVSIFLLNQVAHTLHADDDAPPHSRPLGYMWTENEASKPKKHHLQIADMRAHLCEDVIEHPDTIFERVLDIERDIYHALVCRDYRYRRRNLTNEAERCLTRVGIHITTRLPQDLPLADTLKRMETAQRALHSRQRDHVVHQLQVFLLGLLILNSNLPTFRKRFRETIAPAGNTLSEDASDYLLRLCWLLAAVFHDVGYPGQAVDDVVNAFRGDVEKLLGLGSARHEQQVARLLIDPILEDNSAGFLLFEKVMNAVLIDGATSQKHSEHLRHFFANRAFRDKEHSFCSMFALGLKLLENGKFSANKAHGWREDRLFTVLVRHTLTPIMLHHAAEWYGKTEGKLRDGNRPVDKSIMKRCLRFPVHPLACLLALCDSLQDAHRPAGRRSRKSPPPEEIIECFEVCPRKRAKFVMRLEYRFAATTGLRNAANRIREKVQEIQGVGDLFDGGGECCGQTCVHIRGFCGTAPVRVKGATGLQGRKRCPRIKNCRVAQAASR